MAATLATGYGTLLYLGAPVGNHCFRFFRMIKNVSEVLLVEKNTVLSSNNLQIPKVTFKAIFAKSNLYFRGGILHIYSIAG